MWKFNITHLEHTAIALGMQAIITVVACALWGMVPAVCVLSALPGVFLFYGREHAQAERRIYNKLKLNELTWRVTLNAMKFWEWDEDSQADFLCPVIGCMAVCIGLCFFC